MVVLYSVLLLGYPPTAPLPRGGEGGLEAAQVLAECGHDYPQTRFYTAALANLEGQGRGMLVVGGYTDTGSGALSDVLVYAPVDDRLELRWRTMWKGGLRSSIRTLRAADLDGDGRDELIVLGRVGDEEVDAQAQLKVLGLAGDVLGALDAAQWQSGVYTHGYGMELADLDGDGLPEIISGGFFSDGRRELAELRVWKFQQQRLNRVDGVHWGERGQTRINAIAVGNLAGEVHPVILTAGRTGQLKDEQGNTLEERGELTAWQLDGAKLRRRASYNWQEQGLTRLRELGLADVDGDKQLEIVSVGRFGPRSRPYLCLFRLVGERLQLLGQTPWQDADLGEIRDVAFEGSGERLHILTIGARGAKGQRQGQLGIWKMVPGAVPTLSRQWLATYGDETQVRQMVRWPGEHSEALLSVGFTRRDEQRLGQILRWNVERTR